jgi:predicted AlkP superfamily phosphohydrolase/phosphomutase
MMREVLTDKIIVLGIDGFDPKLAKKFLKMGIMPNLQKLIECGAQREDLVLLGGVPTVTPPMWTTLATGANPNTHGITCFWNHDHEQLDNLVYALDSTRCKAEQLWNVTAEAGKKTLVWHWPGSAWPPSSDNPKLHVVAGTNPGSINQDAGNVEWEKLFIGSIETSEVGVQDHVGPKGGAGCIIEDLDVLEEKGDNEGFKNMLAGKIKDILIMSKKETEIGQVMNLTPDVIKMPIKEPAKWENAPAGAKEAVLIFSDGLIRRPSLLLQNKNGIYDRIAIYKNKKETSPIEVVKKGVFFQNFIDEVKKPNGDTIMTNRSLKLIDIAEDGSNFAMWMSFALDINCAQLFHPKELYNEITTKVDLVQPISIMGTVNHELFQEIVLRSWDKYVDWQADCLNYVIENNYYDVIFSHLHNIDAIGHQSWHLAKPQEYWDYAEGDEKFFQDDIKYIYKQTDRYLGRFLHLLDKEWTVFIVSDHGLISEEHEPPIIGEMVGINIPVMKELGFTVLKKDADGNELREIDWEKTKAVASRGGHIWVNLKGRNSTGCVDPADKYELEREIIDALYAYRDPSTGKRIICMAVRNKEAAIFGMSGPECGDIIYFMEEGFNRVHADSLPTQDGYFDTSVSPIFIAAGKGLKKGHITERVIRVADVAPTIAILAGVRIPAQCEGAPIYQILAEEL